MDWSLASLKEKLIKTGANVVSHGRYVAFQMAEVTISRRIRDSAAHRGTAAAATISASASRFDGHEFKGNRREERVRMPGKTARSDPRPSSRKVVSGSRNLYLPGGALRNVWKPGHTENKDMSECTAHIARSWCAIVAHSNESGSTITPPNSSANACAVSASAKRQQTISRSPSRRPRPLRGLMPSRV